MAEKNSEKGGLGIRYTEQNNEVRFYYNDNLIFINSKSMPFIGIKIEKNNATKELSLIKFEAKKLEDNSFLLRFYDGEYEVFCKIKQIKEKVSFIIENRHEYKEVFITLYKDNKQKTYGLCSYKPKAQELTKKEKILNIFRLKKKENKVIYLDKKLSFYIKEKYFFENLNISRYNCIISDNIYIYAWQKTLKFNLIFNSNIYVAINQENKNTAKIVKFNEEKYFFTQKNINEKRLKFLKNQYAKKFGGVIIKEEDYNLANLMIDRNKTKKLKIRILYTITLYNNKGFFEGEELIKDENGIEKINFDNMNARRKFANLIRKYLDINADGLYFDGNMSRYEATIINKMIKKIVEEYPDAIIFHSTISESNNDFGYYIIKKKDIYKRFDEFKNYYLYSGENRIGCEGKVTNVTKNNLPVKIIDLE